MKNILHISICKAEFDDDKESCPQINVKLVLTSELVYRLTLISHLREISIDENKS